jgi:hypothetical protein
MIDEEFGVASIIMHTPDVCCIFVALYPVTSVPLRGVELFELNLVSFLIYARAWVQARNFLQDYCVLWAWTSFQHTAMIPPCAFANWLHGLHGEAFEEAGHLVIVLFSFTKVVGAASRQLLLSGRAPGRVN